MTDDYERLETELVGQDREAAWVSTADIDKCNRHSPGVRSVIHRSAQREARRIRREKMNG